MDILGLILIIIWIISKIVIDNGGNKMYLVTVDDNIVINI